MYTSKTSSPVFSAKELPGFNPGNRQASKRPDIAGADPAAIRADLSAGIIDNHQDMPNERQADKALHVPASQLKAMPRVKAMNAGEKPVIRSEDTDNRSDAENVTAMPDQLRLGIEALSGMNLSDVRVHQNSSLPTQVNALAYTRGNNIYMGPGQDRHLAHEAWHVVQQKQGRVRPTMQAKGLAISDDASLEREADLMGAKAMRLNASGQASTHPGMGPIFARGRECNLQFNERNHPIQRYIDAKGTKGSAIGHSYRISDDLTAAVKVGYPNHDLYARAGKAALANTKLARVGSGIELMEQSSNFTVSQGSKKKTLKKVLPKNVQNTTSGDNMKIADDCGTSNAVVVGGNKRSALYRDAGTGLNAKSTANTPSLMKAEIMKKMLNEWLTMPSTPAQLKTEINDTIAKADTKQLEINAAETAYYAATTDVDKELKLDIYWAKVDEYGNIMMSFYNKLPEAKREEVDKYLKINKFTSPSVGQGYTMSSGGRNYPGKSTWNFHWGGVVMKSDDQKDTVTLENYAVPGNVENKKWDFAMYGTAAKKGQTFHEQHHDTKQHGDRPTTMTIEKT